ncbi:iron ABC transporter permease [Paenibacillus tarimensis]
MIHMQVRSGRTRFSWGTSLAIGLLVPAIVIPLCLVILNSLMVDGQFDPLTALGVVLAPGVASVLSNTLLLGLLVVAGATAIAFPMAYLAAKTELGEKRWLDVVIIIPFMTPPYIGSMGWILFMQPRGFLEELAPWTAALTPQFFSLGGLVTIMSFHLYPFLYLMLRNSIQRIGQGYEEAGALHGAGFGYRLRRIVIPLLFGSYLMGALLVFVKTIAEFGTPATFGRKIGFYVLTTEIHRLTSSWPIDFGKATALASILLTASLTVWYLQSVMSRKFRYQTLGGKGLRTRPSRLRLLGKSLSWGYVGIVLLLSIGVPYFSIIVASLQKLRGNGLAWGNFTLDHYARLLSWGSPGFKALTNSIGLALLAATFAAVIGTFLALQIRGSATKGQKTTDLFSLLPNTVPGIVIAVGLVLFWNAKWMPIPLYNTYGMAVLTYVVFFLPYTVQYVKASFSQLDDKLFQAGRVYGGTDWYIFRRIALPLLLPGIVAGWMMTFTISARELVASLMLLPPSMHVSATYIFSQFEQGEVSMGMAMAVLTVSLTTIILVIMNQLESYRK